MDHANILDARDIEAPRSPNEFLAWMTEKNRKLSATAETKQFARSGAELAKKFHDEIYPLALFVAQEFGDVPGVLVAPNLNNDNFDAVIIFENSPAKIFIEITQAKDGYDESLRMEVLTKEGTVSLSGPIAKISGRRGNRDRIIRIPHLMRDVEGRFAEHLALVEKVVRAKAGRQYGKNFVLLVVIDDHFGFPDESYPKRLDSFVRSNLLLPELDFMRLVLFGLSGKVRLSYLLPKYSTLSAS
jgi:predicted secreted protein